MSGWMNGQNEKILYQSKNITGSSAFEDDKGKINMNKVHNKILSISSNDYRIYTHHVRQYCYGFHLVSQGNEVQTTLRKGDEVEATHSWILYSRVNSLKANLKNRNDFQSALRKNKPVSMQCHHPTVLNGPHHLGSTFHTYLDSSASSFMNCLPPSTQQLRPICKGPNGSVPRTTLWKGGWI